MVVELTVGDLAFSTQVDTDRQRPAEPDRNEHDVGAGDVSPDRAGLSGVGQQAVENVLGGRSLVGPVGIMDKWADDVDDPESGVDRSMEVAAQCHAVAAGVGERSLARCDGAVEHIEYHGAQKVLPRGEVAVEGGDTDTGAVSDGVTCRFPADLQDQLGCCGEQASPVAASVGPQRTFSPPRVSISHETEYTPPLMSSDAVTSDSDRAEYVPVAFDRCDHVTGPFYHGTKGEFVAGDLLTHGHASNYHDGRISNNVYFAALLEPAIWGAELAVAHSDDEDARGHIYVVEPTGPFEDDPNLTNKKFPGNVTQSYRSQHPLRVVDEVEAWEGHSPEVIQGMLAGIAHLRAQGLDVIED